MINGPYFNTILVFVEFVSNGHFSEIEPIHLIMKALLALLSVLCVSIALYVYLGDNSIKNEVESSYFFDGPDKALIQNMYMIQDPKEKRVPYERLRIARQYELSARIQNGRDFKWKGWDTKIPGRSRGMYYQESTGILFSGSVTGGLWKNSDYKNNATWELVDEFQGTAVNCFANDPTNPDVLYIGTGESHTAIINYRESTGLGNGIYKSSDGGLTWSQIESTSNFYFINDLIVRDENGVGVLYAAVGSGTYQGGQFVQEGLYKSTNQGVTWSQVLPMITGTSHGYSISDLELSASNEILAGTMRNIYNEGGGIILSSSDGNSWNSYTEFSDFTKNNGLAAGRTVIKAAPSNANHLYGLFTMGYTNNLSQLRDYNVFLKHSIDGGESWQDITLPQGWANIPWHALSLSVDPANENKIIIGALNVYVLNDASQQSIAQLDWIKISDWAAMYEVEDPNLSQEERDAAAKRYVHADVHDIQFVNNNSNEVLITTDGGVFYSENMSVTNAIDPENPVQEFPVFKQVNKALNTTQYYYGRIHPQPANQQAIGGAQDNGSIYVNVNPNQNQEWMISGGDGGYCFWDRSNSNVKITTVYGNRYYVHISGNVYWIGNPQFPINGLFVNPMDYDDEANLVYSNAMTSTYGGLYKIANHPYHDTLEIVNINSYLGTPTLGLPVVSFVKLNAGIQDAISAIKLSQYSSSTSKTAIIGTEKGAVYKVRGLPGPTVTTTRIDNGKLPIGYISSIDVGRDENRILVTLSNFGISSVWLTRDGGTNWLNIERNLPDMPVRWGVFNPYDDFQVMIATEKGIWGLENVLDEDEQWQSYNLGFPEIRVDMIDIRKEDSTILAATHGHGFWVGKFTQGEKIITDVTEFTQPTELTWLYPNPASGVINIESSKKVNLVVIIDSTGKPIKSVMINARYQLDISDLPKGIYFFDGLDLLGRKIGKQKIVIQ